MRIFGFLLKLIGGLALAALVAFLFGLVVQHLWNWLMPGLFHLPSIDFWQAFGLVFLSRLLFGNIGGHHHKKHGKKWRKGCCGKDCCDKEGGESGGCCSHHGGWGKLRHHGFFKRWAPDGDPKNLEQFDDWWKDGGEASFESSRLAKAGGWGWWSWWKKEGKGHYEAWLAGKGKP